jgi:transposase
VAAITSPPVPVQTQIIGALPVIHAYFDKLDLAATIDRIVPWEGQVPLGTLCEILIANRLLNPEPLYRLGEWAELAGLTDYYQVSVAQLNDDAFGRALERVAEFAPDIEAALALRAVKEFDLDLAQIHYDITTVELYGAYQAYTQSSAQSGQAPAQEPTPANGYQPPKPTYGHSKSGRKNLKQMQLGLDVLGDGAVPISHRVVDGNTAEATTHAGNLQRLKAVLPTSTFVLITDCKGDTEENLLGIAAEKCAFLCAGAFTETLQQRYVRVRHKMRRIAYYPKSQEERQPEQRDEYRAHEVTELLQGEVNGKKVRLRYRLLFVWSQARALQQEQTRERHVNKIRDEFVKVEKNLNKYSLKTQQAIVARLEKAKGRYSEGSLFEYDLGDKAGQFKLTWRLDENKEKEWKDLEGVYVLKSSRSRATHPVATEVATYKEQSNVEKRYRHVKGPLAVMPAFLEKPQRIAGLLGVVVWALLVMALMERQVRRSLKGKPLLGLYPEKRPSRAPSGPSILACFGKLCVVLFMHEGFVRRQLAQLTAVQRKMLDLLGVLETDLHCYARSSFV